MDSPPDEIETKPVVWIVDSEQWPRAYLRALLLERGFDAIGFIELGEAFAAIDRPHYPLPRIIVLDLHGLSLREDEQDTLAQIKIPIVGIAGAVELDQEWVRKVNWAALIQRPATIGQIADTIEKLIGLPKRS